MQIPTLTTARMTLRAFTEEDCEPLYDILSVEGVLRYFPTTTSPTREQVQKIIAAQLRHWGEHNCGWWALDLHDGPDLIGWCGLQYLPETDEIEVGYLLGKEFWGKGLATEAAQASVNFGFETLGLNQIVGIVHPDNISSQRVLEKSGLRFTNEDNYFGMDCFRYAADRVTGKSKP